MHTNLKCLYCLAALLLMSSAHCESAAIGDSAPLVYKITTDSETLNAWSSGVVAGVIGETYRTSHERFLEALQSDTNGDGKSERLLQPFACLGLDSAKGECRRMIEEKDDISDIRLTELLEAEPTHYLRVVLLKVVFDGRFFQVPTDLYDVHLAENGDVIKSNEIMATYITTYSRKLHEEDIKSGQNDVPFSGKIGSKEARMHFWLAGSNPRLVTELHKSVRMIADLWGAVLNPQAKGILAGDHSDRSSLPRVRDVVRNDATPCKTLHGSFFVVRDLGEYFWLALPYANKKVWNNFYIEPRCGFDY